MNFDHKPSPVLFEGRAAAADMCGVEDVDGVLGFDCLGLLVVCTLRTLLSYGQIITKSEKVHDQLIVGRPRVMRWRRRTMTWRQGGDRRCSRTGARRGRCSSGGSTSSR
jgi:hypothetical protein